MGRQQKYKLYSYKNSNELKSSVQKTIFLTIHTSILDGITWLTRCQIVDYLKIQLTDRLYLPW